MNVRRALKLTSKLVSDYSLGNSGVDWYSAMFSETAMEVGVSEKVQEQVFQNFFLDRRMRETPHRPTGIDFPEILSKLDDALLAVRASATFCPVDSPNKDHVFICGRDVAQDAKSAKLWLRVSILGVIGERGDLLRSTKDFDAKLFLKIQEASQKILNNFNSWYAEIVQDEFSQYNIRLAEAEKLQIYSMEVDEIKFKEFMTEIYSSPDPKKYADLYSGKVAEAFSLAVSAHLGGAPTCSYNINRSLQALREKYENVVFRTKRSAHDRFMIYAKVEDDGEPRKYFVVAQSLPEQFMRVAFSLQDGSKTRLAPSHSPANRGAAVLAGHAVFDR